MKTWLVIDANYICHRAHSAMADMYASKDHTYTPEEEEMRTVTIYGFLRDVIRYQELFQTEHCVFCFDSKPPGKRERLVKTYKQNRRDAQNQANSQQRRIREMYLKQVNFLRDKCLYRIGFKNILHYEGYEGDDHIAAVCKNLPQHERAVIISEDKDLFQLLDGKRVIQYRPRIGKSMTEELFIETYGIQPHRWPSVKAVAGCTSDNVLGIKGVGEKTAIKYLIDHSQVRAALVKEIKDSKDYINKNYKLVKLPFAGCPIFDLEDDCVTRDKWEKVCDQFNMKSIRSTPPLIRKRLVRTSRDAD